MALTVSAVSTPSQREAVLFYIDSWIKLASRKAARVEGVSKEIFQDCKDALCWLRPNLTSDGKGRAAFPVVCLDEKSRVQAIAIYDKKSNYIHWLVTCPNNIRHPINEGIEGRVTGAATEIILYMARETLNSGLPLRLCTFSSAAPFYLKLAFEYEAQEAGRQRMSLTAEKIFQIAKSGILPFKRIIEDV